MGGSGPGPAVNTVVLWKSGGQAVIKVEVLSRTRLTLQLTLAWRLLAAVGPSRVRVCRGRGLDRSSGAGWTRLFLKTPTVTQMKLRLTAQTPAAVTSRRCCSNMQVLQQYIEDSPCGLLQVLLVFRVKGQLHHVTSGVQVHDGIGQPDTEDRLCPGA